MDDDFRKLITNFVIYCYTVIYKLDYDWMVLRNWHINCSIVVVEDKMEILIVSFIVIMTFAIIWENIDDEHTKQH